ncbi:MAG: adenylosuccinate synthase [Bacteroidota bacterium]|nr:adenylosuccinate synthase [Bacteroidota bacterium]
MNNTMHKIDVVLGLQWGDEGKGKIVDVLAGRYGVVARFQGGPNAGHSLHFDGQSFVVRSIPSGIFRDGSTNIIGNGVVLDPISFIAECDNIRKVTGIEPEKKLVIARKAHLILPTHRLLDAAREAAAGKGKIGSTLKGIGPCYSDKIGRNGVRVGDIETPDFRAKYQKLTNLHKQQLADLNFEFDQAALEEDAFFAAVERMKAFKFVDCEFFVDDVLKEQSILAEGAQGSMLDIDYGSYPFVTSSNTTCGGVCTGMGAAPCRIGKVYGIFKAYCTRVGSGPFPTELFDATGEELRRIGHEYGAVTGRPRRCGWIDLVALKYAVTLSGVTDLIMMKSDCLDTFDTIKACTSYLVDGKETDRFPYDISDGRVTPVYTEFPGWKTCLADIRKEEDLPQTFMNYVKFVENYLGAKISIISLGPDREATIERV